MAEFNLEGLLGNAFGGGGGNFLDEYLTPEQRAMMQRNAMLAASAALLKAGGENTRRIGIGEALGSAFEAGQAGYEKAQTGALTQMALKQKLKDAETERATKLAFKNFLAQQGGGAAPPMPKVGDTYPYTYLEGEKAGTSEQRIVTQADLDALKTSTNMTAPVNPPPTTNRQTNLSPNQLSLLSMMDMKTAIPELMKSMQPPKTVGEPFKGTDGNTYVRTEQGGVIPFTTGIAPTPVGQAQSIMMGGKPALVQAFSDGTRKIVPNELPYEPLPTDIRAVEYLRGAPLAGTGQPGISQVGQYRQQIAPSTIVNMPPQEKAFETGIGAGQSKQAIDSKIAAQSAATILETNQTGRSILNSGAITGTGANFFVGLNNALKQAGIDAGYADAAANSQAYAAAMGANVGQLIKQFGAGTGLSDADREYAMQMAGGKITLTEQALRKILDINDKAASKVIDTHNKTYGGVKTNIPLTVEKPAGAAPPPPPAVSQIPTGAPAANLNQQRQAANAAIAKGAPAAAVRQRFKQNTGEEL